MRYYFSIFMINKQKDAGYLVVFSIIPYSYINISARIKQEYNRLPWNSSVWG